MKRYYYILMLIVAIVAVVGVTQKNWYILAGALVMSLAGRWLIDQKHRR